MHIRQIGKFIAHHIIRIFMLKESYEFYSIIIFSGAVSILWIVTPILVSTYRLAELVNSGDGIAILEAGMSFGGGNL